jgi:hypothetical protein
VIVLDERLSKPHIAYAYGGVLQWH